MSAMKPPGRTRARTVSCGVVLLDSDGRVLLAHAPATTHWDIPKGQGEPGETAQQAALRELAEETGIVLDPARLVDLGLFAYRRDKDLHLFAARAGAGAFSRITKPISGWPACRASPASTTACATSGCASSTA